MAGTHLLADLVRGYLESAQFRILNQEEDCLVADKLVFGEERDTRIVWVTPMGRRSSSYESVLLERIDAAKGNYPHANATVVAHTRQGFSRDFLSALASARVRLRVPVQFFDTPFTVERSPKTISKISDIRSASKSRPRVPQPFHIDGQPADGDRDLFVRLREELASPQDRARVRVIVGRAGIGKSILFQSLFGHLYTEFLEAKNRLQSTPRPIPLLPEHVKETGAVRTDRLISNFLRTDIAAPVEQPTFKWLLVHGFTTWLLDGLDELYAGDPDFFDYLLDIVTAPGTKAQITIWCRDSLLTTSDAFAEFRDMCSDDTLQVYRLSEWDRRSKRQLAWVKFKDRLPHQGENDPAEIQSALQSLEQNQTIQSLSCLPFYCDLLLEQIRDSELGDFGDEVSLLDDAIDRLIAREVDKELFDPNSFEDDGLDEWLEEIAADYLEGNSTGVDITMAEEYGEIVLRAGLDDDVRRHIVTSLLQFPIFQAGNETGRVLFAHDLMAEALAARAYVRTLRSRRGKIASRLPVVDPDDPTLLRFVASRLDKAAEEALVDELKDTSDERFSVLLSILLLARPDRDIVQSRGLSFEARSLFGVRFIDRNLVGVSFRRSDLSYAVFEKCDLSRARFEGAYFNGTKFDNATTLRDAEIGNLAGVVSLVVANRLEADPEQVAAWFAGATGQPPLRQSPCPTALQLTRLFGKFVSPLGSAKRKSISGKGIFAGRRYQGAAKIDECVREAARSGYLNGPDRLGHYERTEGDAYAEVVSFVKDHRISDGLGRVIANLCPRNACLHQL